MSDPYGGGRRQRRQTQYEEMPTFDPNSVFASYNDYLGDPAGMGGGGAGDPYSELGFDLGMSAPGGWAGEQGYQGMPLQDQIFENPEYILPDVFPGIDPYGAGYSMLAELPFDPSVLFNLTGGSQGTNMGYDDYTNWLQQMYSAIGGGQYIDFGELMSSLANPDGDLAAWLNHPGVAAETKVGFLKAALGTASLGLTPRAASSLQASIPGMFAGVGNQSLKTPVPEQGNIDPHAILRSGLASLGMGF
ncbi:MAG: hypothetical protein M3464_00370 [Chloroflexota bacterium]|nr:hypothetical protein [Chloroflexota bacterium]